MPSTPETLSISKKTLWAGRMVSALPVLMLLMSAAMKFLKPPEVTEGFAQLGYPESLALGLGLLELVCTVLYVIPQTAVLGAILLTGYLGGATATHVRVGDPYFAPIVLGILVWGGLYLRDPRLRVLIPLRSNPFAPSAAAKRPVLKAVALSFVALVTVLVLVVALAPAEFRITRSTTIAAPPAAVFAQVNDFHNWDHWSPWAKLDPNAKYAFEGAPAGKDAVFTWSGNNEVGEGRMTITDSRPPELVQIKLDFIRPFPSTCTNQCMNFINKQNDLTITGCNFFDYPF